MYYSNIEVKILNRIITKFKYSSVIILGSTFRLWKNQMWESHKPEQKNPCAHNLWQDICMEYGIFCMLTHKSLWIFYV